MASKFGLGRGLADIQAEMGAVPDISILTGGERVVIKQIPLVQIGANPDQPRKTFDDALILVNEAEQYTKENMKLLLTRIGENSKVVITGDCEQVNRRDIVNKKAECGLEYAANHLRDLDEIGITEFTREDIVRNPLITKILDNWD